TSESALEMGCVCTTTLMAQITAMAANARNKITSMSSKFYENSATRNPVTSRFSTAAGNRNFQAKLINWSYRKRGNVPRIQMNTNSKNPVLEANQNSGMTIDTTAGISSATANPKNTIANTGKV